MLRIDELGSRDRYDLLTSLVVPRPIGWLSTYAPGGGRNLAPFSYFSALAASPMLVGVSIGHRREGPKDSLTNLRHSGGFCVNVVSEPLLEKMNDTAGSYPPEVDEFDRAGLVAGRAETVEAPYVRQCPAVLECRVHKEVELEGAPNTLVIGEVRAVRLSSGLEVEEGGFAVDTRKLRPVGRLWGRDYGLLGEIVDLERGEG